MPARIPVPPLFFEMHKRGRPFAEIASACSVSENTIISWTKSLGLPNNGGRRVACLGCSYVEAVAMNDGVALSTRRSKHFKFQEQRKGAWKRGIAWEMTFIEWLGVWMESGKWHLRGAGRGKYCMARTGDVGPYRLGNVRIALFEENSREALVRAVRDPANPRGYTLANKSKAKPFMAHIGRRILGHFATAEEARASYLHAKSSAKAAKQPA